jgi:hypothetical protein
MFADTGDRAAKGMGLRPLACWDCGFEYRRVPGCLSLVSVVCCQVEVSAAGRSLVRSSPTECGVSEYDLETWTMRRPWPTRGCRAMKKKRLCLEVEKIVASRLRILARVFKVCFEESKILETFLFTGNCGLLVNIIRRTVYSTTALKSNLTFFAVRLWVLLHVVNLAYTFLCGASCCDI